MRGRWRWGCLVGLFVLQVVLLWRWLPSGAPPFVAALPRGPARPEQTHTLAKECLAALTALEASSARGELFYRVATARVMVADYSRLRRDFARLRGMSEEAIDAWLLDEVAFLSSNHFAHVRIPPPHPHLRCCRHHAQAHTV
jgi:hypothetical protein